MRTLVLGGTGTIGSAVAAACHDRRLPHLTTSFNRAAADANPLDVRDADGVRELLADYRPDAVVSAAPLDDLDGLATVAAAVRDLGGKLVLFSSAAVFGPGRTAMREEDPTTAKTAAGERFAAAEALVQQALPDRHLIVRTSAVFSAASVKATVKRFARGERVAADDDAMTQPTFAADLAEVVCDLLKHGHAGTFHAVGPDKHTAFAFAKLVAHLFGHDSDLVEMISGGAADAGTLDRFRLRALLGAKAVRGVAEAVRFVRDGGRAAPAVRVAMAA